MTVPMYRFLCVSRRAVSISSMLYDGWSRRSRMKLVESERASFERLVVFWKLLHSLRSFVVCIFSSGGGEFSAFFFIIYASISSSGCHTNEKSCAKLEEKNGWFKIINKNKEWKEGTKRVVMNE